HAKLAGNPAFPNFGEDLRRLAARDLPGAETVRALNAVRTPRPLGTVLDEKIAYVLAGSVVGFLIERHGLPQVRSVDETERYETAYGKPFASREGDGPWPLGECLGADAGSGARRGAQPSRRTEQEPPRPRRASRRGVPGPVAPSRAAASPGTSHGWLHPLRS